MGAFNISEIGLLIIMEWDIIDIMHSMGTLPILNLVWMPAMCGHLVGNFICKWGYNGIANTIDLVHWFCLKMNVYPPICLGICNRINHQVLGSHYTISQTQMGHGKARLLSKICMRMGGFNGSGGHIRGFTYLVLVDARHVQ